MISAQMVNTLRQKTGVGMNKCKEALIASDGDQAKAEHWLRVQLPAHKPSEKLSGEGVVVVNINDSQTEATIVELLCDTDFTAKNSKFIEVANRLSDLDDTEDANVRIDELRMIFKENIALSSITTWTIENGKLGSYVHSNGKLGVVVVCEASKEITETQKFLELIKDLAMHVAGASPPPEATDRTSLSQSLVDSEKKVIEDQFKSDPKNAKKPVSIKEKIISGKLDKFYKEKVLLEQNYIKDETKTIAQVIEGVDKSIKVVGFTRRQIG